jgi:hypothetical protein
MDREDKLRKLLFILQDKGVDYELNKNSGSITLQTLKDDQKNIKNNYIPAYFELTLDEKGYLFMQVDDYHWEFDRNFNEAVPEIKKYVQAFVDNRLIEKTTQIGPLVLSRKLEVKS